LGGKAFPLEFPGRGFDPIERRCDGGVARLGVFFPQTFSRARQTARLFLPPGRASPARRVGLSTVGTGSF